MKLKTNQLYIMSGPPCSRKSTFLKDLNIPSDMIVCMDTLRINLLGERKVIGNGHVKTTSSEIANHQVFVIALEMVKARCRMRLTTFVDSTNLDDKTRKKFVDIATSFGMASTILISQTTISQALEWSQSRERYVSDDYIKSRYTKMNYSSKFDYILIDPNIKYELTHNIINHTDIDVVGDVHGLYDELVEFIQQLGYYVEDEIIYHPDNRKLLFLGDVVDRGPKSVETLTLVANSVIKNGHYMIRGNHDYKILKYFDLPDIQLSQANAETVGELMKLKKKDREYLIDFLRTIPFYQTIEDSYKFVFTHASIPYFTPHTLMHDTAVYGVTRGNDTDREYDDLYLNGHNKHILIHGHQDLTSEKRHSTHTLEMKQAFGGELAILPLDHFLDEISTTHDFIDSFSTAVKTFDVSYDYNKVRKLRTLQNSLLTLDKSLIKTNYDSTGLQMFKYSKKVFWDNLWNSNPVLLKARGLVLDASGNIVQHVFDKVYNYGENDAGQELKDDDLVQSIQKINGFFGAITKHPYKQELLITTTGSFDSPHVGMINDHISPKLRGNLMKYFHDYDITLMFEINHSNDPHIIECTVDDWGLWLIGARSKNQNDEPLLELDLDAIAKRLGLNRPRHKWITFGKVKEELKNCKHEGFMIRNETGSFVCKFKSPFYLTTKFLGRMSSKNIHHMFNDPKRFKQKVDEDFWIIVDILLVTTTASELIDMDKQEQTSFVRNLITNML